MSKFKEQLDIARNGDPIDENLLMIMLNNTSMARKSFGRSIAIVLALIITVQLGQGDHIKYVNLVVKVENQYLIKWAALTLLAFFSFKMQLYFHYLYVAEKYVLIYAKHANEQLHQSSAYHFLIAPALTNVIRIPRIFSRTPSAHKAENYFTSFIGIVVFLSGFYVAGMVLWLACVYYGGKPEPDPAAFDKVHGYFILAAVVSLGLTIYSYYNFITSFLSLREKDEPKRQ